MDGILPLLENSKILIIEDDRTQRLLLRQIFEDYGFKNVEEAINGKAGWEKTLALDPDLVVLDMNMPVMNGFEYCKMVRSNPDYQDTTILVQTGLTDLKDKAEIFKVGATDYVTKPLDFHEVTARSIIHLKNSHNVKELREYNTRVKNELVAARNLIEISLPDERAIKKLEEEYKIDLAAKFESCQEMGGDFWGAYPINKEQVAIYSIDVSGHGIDSALSALRIHTLLHANADQRREPKEILEWLNNQLVKLFPVGQFATMFFGVIDVNSDKLTYSTASSTSPIILYQNKFPPKIVSGKGYPLGALNDATFETKSIPFKKGDTLILYSDAITEAQKKNSDMLGEDGLVDLLEKAFKKQKKFTSQGALDIVLKMFHKEYGDKLDDDLTVNFYHRLA